MEAAKSLATTGGRGANSYSSNSSIQRRAAIEAVQKAFAAQFQGTSFPRMRKLSKKAFAAQFQTDMGAFLKNKAKELVGGGLAMVVITGLEDGSRRCKTRLEMQIQLLGPCLNDMADRGVLSKKRVDSFNVHVYFPHLKDVQEAVEENGDFEVEELKGYRNPEEMTETIVAESSAKYMRSVVERLIVEQFGSVYVDEIFELYKLNSPKLVSFPWSLKFLSV